VIKNQHTLGAAVVGLGVGAQHALAYARLPSCELKWLYDIDRARAEEAAIRVGSGAIAGSFNEILRDPAVDIVSIASYDDQHFEQTLAALEAGKNVFVEKPLCRTLHEARGIAAAQRSSGRLLQSNLVLRASPLYRWLKSAIDSGELGRIYAIDGDYLYGRIEKITKGWRGNVDDYSVMTSGGVHMVDLMLWMLDERATTVSASGNRICTAETSFEYLDFVAATYQFPSGAIGRITANFGCVHGHQHVFRVFGTRGTFIHDDRGARLQTHRDPAPPAEPISLISKPLSKGDLIPDFVASVIVGADTAPLVRRELELIAACAAVQPALDQPGHNVEIEYV